MSRNRIADLQLRGSTSPLPVRVYWPGQAAARPVPLLVFCIVGAGAGAQAETPQAETSQAETSQAEAACRGLSEDPGLVVLAVRCLGGAQDGTSVLEWAAEHAAELGADPGRLLVAGQGAGSAVAAAVVSQARAAGWPAVMLATGKNDADLASGLVNTTSQVGGALGLAVLATVSAGRTGALAARGEGAAAALTGGYHLAFWIAAGLVAAGIAVAATVLRSRD
jgi:alpha/beta hydrolase fold